MQTQVVRRGLKFSTVRYDRLKCWVLSKIIATAEKSFPENLSKWIDMMDVDELFVTALNGNQIETCMKLIENGTIVNGPDRGDIRPLTLAVREERFDMCELLIKRGASVNAKGHEYEEPPLYYALTGNKPELVPLLLRRGAEFTIKVRNRPTFEHSPTMAFEGIARNLKHAGIFHVL